MPSLRSVADTSGTNVKVPAFATNTHEILSSSAFKTSSISSPAALFNMRFTYVLAAAAALAGSGLVQGLSLNPKTLPVSKHLYSFSLEFAENRNVSGPLGKRVGLGLTGGNMTAPNGTLIGKVVPGVGGETGIIDNNNNLEIDVKAFFQFLDDKKYAYAAIAGIGPLTGKPMDAHHIETDSPSRLAWNSYFIVANVSLVTPALLVGDAFAFATS